MRKDGGKHCRGIAKNTESKCVSLQSGNSQNKMSRSSTIKKDLASGLAVGDSEVGCLNVEERVGDKDSWGILCKVKPI